MKKIFSLVIAIAFGLSQVACASTQVPAQDVTVNTSSFSGNLNSTDNTVQAALNTLDQVQGGGSGSVNWGDIHGLLSNQTDLQTALNSKISGVNWGGIGGVLSSQSDLITSLNGKVATSVTVNGHALTGNVTVTKSDVGLGNVQNVDTTNASNITTGTILNSLLASIPNTAINWTSLTSNIQSTGINWASITASQLQGNGINWASVAQYIQAGNVNWPSLLSGQIQNLGINWTSLNQSIQATGINWSSIYSSQLQASGINWANLSKNIQSPGINWTSLSKVIQTSGINWQSVINSEIQNLGINWTSLNANIVETAFNFTDVTTGNASITAHGLSPKLPNNSSLFYNGVGGFTAPPGSGTINSSTIGYYGQYTGSTTISGISVIPASGINWTSLNASVQASGVNWTSLIQSVQATGINWTSLVQNIQATGLNWSSLNNTIQSGGINWTSLNNVIQYTGINWTSLVNSVQGTGINWASIISLIQTGNINWTSVKNLEIQAVGINWASIVGLIQANAMNWPSVNAGQILGAGVNWASVGNVQTGGTFTTNGLNAVGSAAGILRLYELPSNGNTYLAFQAPNTVNTSVTWTFPAADAVGCFQSNGSGTISIGTCGSGSGSGTVNSGTQYQLGYYATTGTAISGNANIYTDASNDLTIGGKITTGGTGTSTFGYGAIFNSNGNSTASGGDLSFKNAVGTTIFNIGASSGNMTIPVTGSIQCLHASATGVVSGTGSDCGAGGGGTLTSVGLASTNGTLQIGNTPITTSGNITADINWTNLNGIASLNTGGLNWSSINSLAKLNSSGINWSNINLLAVINSGGLNWNSVNALALLNNTAVNWASLSSNVNSLGINWSNVNASAVINSGAFTSTTGSGNQVVLANGPTISSPDLTGNVGIGSVYPGKALDINGTARMTGFTLSTGASNGYYLKSDASGNGTWASVSGSGTVTSITLATPNSTLSLSGTNPITTSGTVNADINLANPNTWTGQQIFNSANVGIGSAYPGKALDVQGTVRALNFSGNGSGLTGIPTSVSNSDSSLTISPTTGAVVASLNVGNPNTWTAPQNFTGNIGIGSASPGQALDINGTARLTGSIIANGSGFTVFGSNVGIGSTSPSASLVVVGHTQAHGTAPTSGTCGSSPSFGSLSTDDNGSITVGLGATTTSCAVNFNATWLHAPNCIVQDDTNPLAVSVATSTTVMTVTSLTTMSTVSVGDKLTWQCKGVE